MTTLEYKNEIARSQDIGLYGLGVLERVLGLEAPTPESDKQFPHAVASLMLQLHGQRKNKTRFLRPRYNLPLEKREKTQVIRTLNALARRAYVTDMPSEIAVQGFLVNKYNILYPNSPIVELPVLYPEEGFVPEPSYLTLFLQDAVDRMFPGRFKVHITPRDEQREE